MHAILVRAVLLAAIAVFLVSCSDSNPTIVRGGGLGAWSVEYPLSNRGVNSMWAGGGVVYAVGAGGLIMRHDGSRWGLMSSPVTTALRSVWGAGPRDLYAVGANGVVLHYNGSAWTAVSTYLSGTMTAVTGTSGSDVYTVGVDGSAAHYNGSAWLPAGPVGDYAYLSAWANGDGSVFFGADSVLAWDGFRWTSDGLAQGALVVALWGTSYTNMYAANDGGSAANKGIYHFDGSAWQRVYDTGTPGPGVIVGTGTDDVFAIGRFVANGAVHWNGSLWSEIAAPVDGQAACIAGGDLLVADNMGAVARYDGASSAFEPGLAVVNLLDVWTWPQGAYAVGERGTILGYNGSAWLCMETGVASPLRAVWGAAPGDAFAVGDDGVILHYDGNGWSGMDSGSAGALRDVWGTSGDNVYAVGDDGLVLRYNGSVWGGAAAPGTPLLSVWGSGADDVYAGAANGELYRYNGTSWGMVPGPDSEQLMDVWGTAGNAVFAVEPRVSLYNGVGVGPAGRIHFFDGAAWTVMADSLFTRPLRLWGTSDHDVYAAGTEYEFPGMPPFIITGRILHYDGVEWSETGVEIPRRLSGISGTANGDAVAVGDAGTIIRARR